MNRPRVRARNVAATAALFVAVAACSDDPNPGPDETTPATSVPTPTAPVSDGQLTIGVMLPPTATLLRDPIQLGVESAIDAINQSGGVFGKTVRLETVDEGSTTASGSDAVQNLLSKNVDAIVGPMSSTVALGVLPSVVDDGVLACSPTASALALDTFPDNGLFVRTVPSDSMQAKAIVQVAEDTGVLSVAVAYVDDGYGRPLSKAVTTALADVPIEVVDTIPFASGDVQLDAEIQRVADSGARVLILLAASNDGTQFLEQLGKNNDVNLDRVIVNDALRSAESAQRLAALPNNLRSTILGVAPQSQSADSVTAPFDPAGPFATQAFDCVTLIALAAGVADSDLGADIAAALPSISFQGSPCNDFADCNEQLASGLQIDYNGPSGLTELGPTTGDPSRARFDRFVFDEQGHDTPFGNFVVEA